MSKVACPFYGKCENSDKECNHCRFNSNCVLANYLILKNKEGKPVRYIEG